MKRYLIVILIGIAAFSCKKDEEEICCDATNPECPNYNPCIGESEVSAEFVIEEYMGQSVPDSLIYYNTESLIFSRRILRFRHVDDELGFYKWYLGSEIINTQSFTRLFDDSVPYGTEITVSLVFEKTPNLVCFPMDDGRDSVAKTFTIVDYCDLPIDGKFKGIFHQAPDSVNGIETPTDSAIVEISYLNFIINQCSDNSTFINLGGIQDTLSAGSSREASDFIYFSGTGSGSPHGYAVVNQDIDIITLDYDYLSQHYNFSGIRIE